MIPKEKQAAQMLNGKTLNDGWKVTRKIQRANYKSGGVYSCCYEVVNEERKGFLKAFDLSGADKIGSEASEQIRNILNAFKLEKDILDQCSKLKCRNVIQLLGYGDLEVDEAEKYPRVDYLILEYAENGDIRDVIENKSATTKFKLKSLHQLAKGLNQIHSHAIAHQDIKPSNVVIVEKDRTMLTDFGSAVFLNTDGIQLPPHLLKDYAGSYEYAPPELLYGYTNSDPVVRRIGCDLYLLGSMIAFYVTNSSMTGLIRSNLEDRFCWINPSTYGKYLEIRPYLIMAYEKAIEDIKRMIEDEKLRETLALIVKYLCHPDPIMRGHEKNIEQLGPNYGLNRIMTMFDSLYLHMFVKNKENGISF